MYKLQLPVSYTELSDLINSCSISHVIFFCTLHVQPNPNHYKMIASFSDGVNFKWNLEEWATLDYLDWYK